MDHAMLLAPERLMTITCGGEGQGYPATAAIVMYVHTIGAHARSKLGSCKRFTRAIPY